MEDKESIILKLQNEIKARDEEVILAGKYGNQLLADNAKLSSKIDELLQQIEKLQQENYSLALDVERKALVVVSQTQDAEVQREEIENLTKNLKEGEILQKKVQNLSTEIQYLKKVQDDLSVENSSLKEKNNVLSKQLSNFEDQVEKSMNETYRDEYHELQSQLNTYMKNNKDLNDALCQCQCELQAAKKNENHLSQMVKELEDTVNEKKSEISAYHEELNKAKEEIEELQGTIEILKFDQIDVNKRGNSVFAELDDRRTLVEREYKMLRKKFDLFQKDYEEKKKELDLTRGQIAILQSMTSRDHQQTYIDALEESLFSARKEISDLTHKLSKAVKANKEKSVMESNCSDKNEYDYLSVMLELSRKKENELQNEVAKLKTKQMHDQDNLIKTQQHLYKTKDDLYQAKQEILKLKQEIKELKQGIFLKHPEEKAREPRIEIVEGFEPPSKTNENTKPLNQSIFADLPDFDVPGELELGEDGFKQIKPPRKSNKFILQEFNKVEPEEENELKKNSGEIKERVSRQSVFEKTSTDFNQSTRSNRSRYSKKKNDNCAQQ